MRKAYRQIIAAFLLILFPALSRAGIEKITYRSYPNCYKITNDSIEMIVVANAGARVLAYKLLGTNIIWENSSNDGKLLADYQSKKFDPDAGRFDVGPEQATKDIHDITWMGPYTAEITGEYSMQLTGQDDTGLGIRMTREFILDSASTHLVVRQTMLNISGAEINWHFWYRTLVPLGGKVIVPLHHESNYPFGWGTYRNDGGSWAWDNQTPSVAQVSLHDSLLSYMAVTGVKSNKFGVDADDGWMAYGYQGMLFVVRVPYFPEGIYVEDSSQTLTWYTNGSQFAEIEPYGPKTFLQPGDSSTMDIHWWLLPYSPALAPGFDVHEAAAFILGRTDTTAGDSTGIPNGNLLPGHLEKGLFRVHPNPAISQLWITLERPLERSDVIEIHSMNGSLAARYPATDLCTSENAANISVQVLPAGIYTIRVVSMTHPPVACRFLKY